MTILPVICIFILLCVSICMMTSIVNDYTSNRRNERLRRSMTSTPPPNLYYEPTKSPMTCFYNTAYEDKNKYDKVPDLIKSKVSNCYVLVDPDNTSASEIAQLKSAGNKVGCYMSVGSIENYRKDFKSFKKDQDYKSQLPGWEEEYMLLGDASGKPTANTINLMKKRISDMAALKCDYIEFDNMDFTGDDNIMKKQKLTRDGIRAYNKELCNFIKSNNMKCMYKNMGPSDPDAALWDGITLESDKDSVVQWEPSFVKKFIDRKAPVYISHYGQPNKAGCDNIYKKFKSDYKDTFGLVCSVYDNKQNTYLHY